MRSIPLRIGLCVAALAAALYAEILFTGKGLRLVFEPGKPLSLSISDTVEFHSPRNGEDPAVIAAVERSSNSDFEGMVADLEAANVFSSTPPIGQQNVPVRISTKSRMSAGRPECHTFFEVKLAPHTKASFIALRGNPLDGADRSGESGNYEFTMSVKDADAAVALTMDPGMAGDPMSCAGTLSVAETAYQFGGLLPMKASLLPEKKGTFRFSGRAAADGRVRMASSFAAKEIVVRHSDGTVRCRYTAANVDGVALQELVLRPAALELSMSGAVLWFDSGSSHWPEWASQNSGRVAIYSFLDLLLLATLGWQLYLWIQSCYQLPPAPAGPYVFISYSHADREHAQALAHQLQDASISIWFDENLKPGERWVQGLQERIERSFAFVVLLTPESTKSSFVTREIQFALSVGKRVLPVLARETNNLLLMDVQHIDGRNGRDVLPELLQVLRAAGFPIAARAAAGAG